VGIVPVPKNRFLPAPKNVFFVVVISNDIVNDEMLEETKRSMVLVGFQALIFQTRRDAHPSLAVVSRCTMRLIPK